jgi:hypothetical protein
VKMFIDQIQPIDRKKGRLPDLPPARRAIRIDRSSLGHFRPAARVALLHPHWRRVTEGKEP